MQFIKERKNGLLLIILSLVVMGAFSFYSKKAVSKESKNSNKEGQVLAEETIKQNENIAHEENNQKTNQESPVSQEENFEIAEVSGKVVDEKIASTKQDKCDDLKDLLKKYCDKSYNTKKCRKYLLEARDLAKSDDQCETLYKKYHFVKKKDEKKIDNIISESDSKGITRSLIITGNGKKELHEIFAQSGVNVTSLMDIGKISYDKLSSGLLDNIGGMGKMSGNMSWMLYVCKGEDCKLSSVGASDCKIDGWDKIEWRFLDWTEITSWDSW